ncbi:MULTISPECIES: inorganic phosphate transporter [unclassified Synechococcus]|uniref:inorganic phosphate transporter n=1 Tax=unclassified Synechococcus TaxID=2626047 RepID=UPI00006995CE|nr:MULTISPECIES: inorganic phosphate transporter [unclassified Synechococcus]EAQ74462.1 phosphate permease, putative [Synechococcus sp. WH 5701]WFN60225.1 inorganic phosphate transporter [Synechococcus sp. CCFWC 502]CAK6700249.1 hypothetical protein ICNINCKA_02807 [Synechococcus sp. CBW1107]
MELIASLFFLSSGLFLGWSLGANDASNVFGSAVGSRMVRFSTAAFLCSVFVIIGAVSAGAGASGGLEALGSVNALAGSFTTALAAAVTVYWMTRLGLPVSTTQAVVGAIVGWNWFSGSITDPGQLAKIVGTWVFCPILAGLFSALLYFLAVRWIGRLKPHLLRLDANVRFGLLLGGIFGSYSLGANNIGNVMGVFVDSSPFRDIRFENGWEFSGLQQLFLLGAIAIAVGVYTFSRRVMMTVGGSLMTLSPMGALVVVVSNSLVLFIFSSSALSNQLVNVGLPAIPLIPVSSSQAVIGAVIGIGCLQGIKGLRQVRWGVLVRIASGWVTTPLIAAVVGLCMLFVVQNVFGAQVYKEVFFQITPPVLQRLASQGIPISDLPVQVKPIGQAVRFRKELRRQVRLSPSEEQLAIASAEIDPTTVDSSRLKDLDPAFLSPDQRAAIAGLEGRSFRHRWQLEEALAQQSSAWRMGVDRPGNEHQNKQLQQQMRTLAKLFLVSGESSDHP